MASFVPAELFRLKDSKHKNQVAMSARIGNLPLHLLHSPYASFLLGLANVKESHENVLQNFEEIFAEMRELRQEGEKEWEWCEDGENIRKVKLRVHFTLCPDQKFLSILEGRRLDFGHTMPCSLCLLGTQCARTHTHRSDVTSARGHDRLRAHAQIYNLYNAYAAKNQLFDQRLLALCQCGGRGGVNDGEKSILRDFQAMQTAYEQWVADEAIYGPKVWDTSEDHKYHGVSHRTLRLSLRFLCPTHILLMFFSLLVDR